MKQTVLTGLLSTLLLGTSVSAISAETPSWNYATLHWVADGEIDAGNAVDLSGYRLDVAKGLGEFMLIHFISNAYHVDEAGIRVDFSTQQLGVGAHYPLNAGFVTFDLWGTVNHERVTNILGIVGTGPGVDVGLRALFTPAFEIGILGKAYGDIDFDLLGDADYTGYTVSASYKVMSGLALEASCNNYKLEFDNAPTYKYGEILGLGVRLNY